MTNTHRIDLWWPGDPPKWVKFCESADGAAAVRQAGLMKCTARVVELKGEKTIAGWRDGRPVALKPSAGKARG